MMSAGRPVNRWMNWEGMSAFLVAMGRILLSNCPKITILYDEMRNRDDAANGEFGVFCERTETILRKR